MLMRTGTIAGTGALLTFDLGFVPKYVKVFNHVVPITLEWNDKMASGGGDKIIAAGTHTYVATNGITPLGGTSALTVSADNTNTDGNTITLTNVKGFTLGTDSVNGSTNALSWVAYGDDGES